MTNKNNTFHIIKLHCHGNVLFFHFFGVGGTGGRGRGGQRFWKRLFEDLERPLGPGKRFWK